MSEAAMQYERVRLGQRFGEVVDGLAAHGLLGEVGRHPGRDRRGAAPGAPVPFCAELPPGVPVPFAAPVPAGVRPDCPAPGKPPRPPGPPPGPPPKPAEAGPALGIAPVCAVPAVSSAYAVGPASPATRARPSGAVASASRARRDPGPAARRAMAGPASTLLASTRPAAAAPAASTT